jgi:RNA 3'-terminal phosphate cyclase (ATP)
MSIYSSFFSSSKKVRDIEQKFQNSREELWRFLKMETIIIDGSYGEGGGQIVRTSIALSALSGKTVKIVNIRAKRRNPGLQHQHLSAVRAIAEIATAEVNGAKLGSTELTFSPGKLRSGTFKLDVGTAGSVTLIAQALLPILPFLPGPTTIEMRGGTDVPWSPTSDYFAHVVKNIAEKIGLRFSFEVLRRGYYPRGGGVVRLSIEDPPGSIEPFKLLERGEIKKVEIWSVAHNLPRHVAERQANAASNAIVKRMRGIDIIERIEDDSSGEKPLDPGSSVAVIAHAEHSILGADSLGERGKRAEVVGTEAAEKLLEDISTGKALDRHMSDMMIPLAAIAGRGSELGGSMLTEHAITNAKVVESILGVRMLIDGSKGKPFTLKVL